MKRLFLAAAFAVVGFAPAAKAWSNELQWRTTQCQVQEGSTIIATNKCQAAFAYDTAIRAMKFWDGPNNRWIYLEIGRDGATFANDSECINVNYENGLNQLFCTVPTSVQLGIQGD